MAITARESISTFALGSVNFAQTAVHDMQWSSWQASFDTESTVLLDLIAFLRTATNVAGRIYARRTMVAVTDDTWESVSVRS